MKKKDYITYKINNFQITKIQNEIILLYKGKQHIYTKNIKGFNSFFSLKKLIYLSALISIISIYYIYTDIYSDNNSSPIENITKNNDIDNDGDKEKNDILFSSKTDFSSEERNENLTIRGHIVQPGDTLSELAKEYGVSMDTICGSNQLDSYDIIQTGRKLLIPNKDGILYKIKRGQDIIDIAKKYKVSVKKIIAENQIKNFDFLYINDEIFIPDAKPQNIIPGFLWPTPNRRITSSYGWRRHPINRTKQFHQGMDIRSKYQLIRATKYGKVTYAGWMGKYGRAIIIAHPGGWKSLYGHLSRIIVRKGQYVKQGQFIGKSGNTGYSTGPHLHFELIKDERHKNPYKYIQRR